MIDLPSCYIVSPAKFLGRGQFPVSGPASKGVNICSDLFRLANRNRQRPLLFISAGVMFWGICGCLFSLVQLFRSVSAALTNKTQIFSQPEEPDPVAQDEGMDESVRDYLTAVEYEEEEEVRPAIEKRVPRREGTMIEWKKSRKVITGWEIFETYGIYENEEVQDVQLSLTRDVNDQMLSKNKEETPSLWDYDRRCFPEEFIGLDRGTFLEEPVGMNLCFLAGSDQYYSGLKGYRGLIVSYPFRFQKPFVFDTLEVMMDVRVSCSV